MPTYEYECSSCRHAWELFQSIKADPERKCPKCGRMTARRKIGMGAAILSGGRSAEPREAPASAAPTASAGTAGTTAATGAAPAKDGAKSAPAEAKSAPAEAKSAPAEAKSAPAAPAEPAAPAATPAERGTLNSTHPARDGRGAGNLRDAIRRQRGEPRGTAPKGDARAAAKPAARAPAKPSANRAPSARRGGRSR